MDAMKPKVEEEESSAVAAEGENTTAVVDDVAAEEEDTTTTAAVVDDAAADVAEENGVMLNETEQFIEKIEAVEKDRRESETSEPQHGRDSASGIEIIVQRPSFSEEIPEEVRSRNV